MSDQNRSFRIPLVIFGCVALSTAFSRCSPVSPSTSKFRQSTSAPNPTTPGPTIENVSSGNTPPLSSVKLLDVPTNVLALNDYNSSIASLAITQTITLSADTNSNEFDSLKKNRAVILHIGGKVSGDCKGYLAVTLSDRAIEDAGLNAISTRCTQVSDVDWLFAISSKVPDSTWSQIVNSLQRATISVSNATEISVSSVTLIQVESSTETHESIKTSSAP